MTQQDPKTTEHPKTKTTIKAKPTMYKGVQMRSRLEATWAAFFDEIGVAWEYEPAVESVGYIPDFLFDDGSGPCFAEVKPFTEEEQWVEALRKARRAGFDGFMCLGLTPDYCFFDRPGGIGVVPLKWEGPGHENAAGHWAQAKNLMQWHWDA